MNSTMAKSKLMVLAGTGVLILIIAVWYVAFSGGAPEASSVATVDQKPAEVTDTTAITRTDPQTDSGDEPRPEPDLTAAQPAPENEQARKPKKKKRRRGKKKTTDEEQEEEEEEPIPYAK